MTTLDTALAPEHRRPAGGGASRVFLGIELRRLLRNKRTVFFTLFLPPIFLFAFGTSPDYKTDFSVGNGNVTAYITFSMALYGALLATTSGGAAVSIERNQGWTRQLRLTPLRPAAYVATKIFVAMLLGLAATLVVMLVGAFIIGAQAPWWVWLSTGALIWVGSAVFAAFGLFMGYVLPAENVMQILGPGLALLAFAGGLFIPLSDGWFKDVAQLTPMYGLAEITRLPLAGGSVDVWAVVNVIVWAAIFVAGAVWRFRRDTQRV